MLDGLWLWILGYVVAGEEVWQRAWSVSSEKSKVFELPGNFWLGWPRGYNALKNGGKLYY